MSFAYRTQHNSWLHAFKVQDMLQGGLGFSPNNPTQPGMSPTLSAGGIRNTYIMKPRFTWAVKGSPKFRLILQTLKYELITLYNTVGCRAVLKLRAYETKN